MASAEANVEKFERAFARQRKPAEIVIQTRNKRLVQIQPESSSSTMTGFLKSYVSRH